MHRSTYQPPAEAPAPDTVVLPDALNLPPLEEPTGTVPPVPPSATVELPVAPVVERPREASSRRGKRAAVILSAVVIAGVLATGAALLLRGGAAPTAEAGDDSTSSPYASGRAGEGGLVLPRSSRAPTPSPSTTPRATPSPSPSQAEPSQTPQEEVAQSAPASEAPVSRPDTDATNTAPSPTPTARKPSATATPKPTPPASPSTPDPLAFTGLTKNYGVDLLGIRVLGSYTLSLTGEPGSTAAVTYGPTDAGDVTFDGSGQASITFGPSLVDLDLANPVIRAEYSDGTEGSVIEARRNTI